MRALGERVLILEEDQPENVRDSGLLVVDLRLSEWKTRLGRVLSIGSKVLEPISIGDLVVYDYWHTARMVGHLDRRTHVIESRDILAIVEV